MDSRELIDRYGHLWEPACTQACCGLLDEVASSLENRDADNDEIVFVDELAVAASYAYCLGSDLDVRNRYFDLAARHLGDGPDPGRTVMLSALRIAVRDAAEAQAYSDIDKVLYTAVASQRNARELSVDAEDLLDSSRSPRVATARASNAATSHIAAERKSSHSPTL